ncbi:integral membrane sensor signal transduction histidine kinase [Desulfovibrio sp. X2]|uniref:sensor histidine kinase n=1 Tax=Desulfovibrio sp. X2 TaxID=941449 RepID=UPI000358C2C5|nr:ATP-binding protein [Desulfovibrio sp. X2]EPR41588.1 integral membrane sensor signal transduction histidine kinase [Desulfovibrio sp. X2]
MDRSTFRNLRWKIIAVTLLFSLVPLFALGWFIHTEFSRSFRAKVQAQLTTIVESKRSAIDMFLDERVTQLRNLADTHSFAELSDQKRLNDLFQTIQSASRSFIDLGIIDGNGVHVAYAGPYHLEGVNYHDATWFQQVMLKGLYISDVFLGFRHFPHFIIAVARHEGGKTWIMRATIDSEVFSQLVRSVQVGQLGDAYLINAEGQLQTPSRFAGSVMDQVGAPGRGHFPGVLVEQGRGRDGSRITGMTWLRRVNWMLVVSEDLEEELSPLVRAQTLVLILVFCGALVIFTGAYLVTGNLVGKLFATEREKAVIDASLMQSSKMAALGKMAAGVAHEINNPLTLIRENAGWIKDLLSEEKPENIANFDEIKAAVEKIDLHVERAKTITHRMLGFAKRMDPIQESVDLTHVVEQTLKFLDNEAVHRNISIVKEFAPLPPIATDPSQIQQVALNLLENAIDAIDKDGTVTVSTGVNGKYVWFRVSDTGTGIPADKLDKIFDPFFTTKAPGEGTGLGLAISYSIVEKLGGHIDVASEEGSGATFTVFLPQG